MRLNIRPYNCAGGENFMVEISESSTIQDIKKRISEKVTDMPPENQKLVYRGTILKNSDTSASAGFINTNACVVNLYQRDQI